MQTETVIMPRALTAENGAKGLLSGEFFETANMKCEDCERFSAGDLRYLDDLNRVLFITLLSEILT